MSEIAEKNTLKQDEINNVLWKACDTSRGKTDSSVYKDYILVMLFVKYLSDAYKEHYEDYSRRYKYKEVLICQLKIWFRGNTICILSIWKRLTLNGGLYCNPP